MFKELLEIIVCPECRKKLELNCKNVINDEVIEGVLLCSNNHKWRIQDGIVNFESNEQALSNNWSELYDQLNYAELDRLVTERTPQIEREGMEVAKSRLINSINGYKARKVLDIATGRGMLLTKLVEAYGCNLDLVCVDLSFDVLKYDRIKALNINPNMKINYVACDASKLPFLNNAFDLSVSFCGIANMGSLASKGIQEGVRVSKNGLLNVSIVIKDDNPKIDELNKMLVENGYDIDLNSYTESNFYKLHTHVNNFKVKVTNVFEGIAEKNENDLLPIEGEWFAMAISTTNKV